MKYVFIDQNRSVWPVGVQCRVLEVSRAGFYDWLGREPSARELRRRELAGKVREVYREHKGRYGSPRVYEELVLSGESVSLNTVTEVMRSEGLRARRKRKFTPTTTDSRHQAPVAENLLDRDFKAAQPDTRWVVDITYVPTGEGWLYVAAVSERQKIRVGFRGAIRIVET